MFLIILLLIINSSVLIPQTKLPGFALNEYSEQVKRFRFEPGINVLVNVPPVDQFNKKLPVVIVLYALPNGNSTEWTIGKKLQEGDDWHFGIQNIGAQTRYLRNVIKDYQLVTVYLETDQKSWPAWKAAEGNYQEIIRNLYRKIIDDFRSFEYSVVLSGHSGGGRFIFSFIDAYNQIPENVKRISFLDSSYGYDSSYTEKLVNWIKDSPDHYLSVLAYNDSNVTINGKNIVSPTGGTWYRSRQMKTDLAKEFLFSTYEDSSLIIHKALQGRINITLKKNPDNQIFHTVQVEKNGFIHSILTGTSLEGKDYTYFGERAYDDLQK